jgi:hypothetical protein
MSRLQEVSLRKALYWENISGYEHCQAGVGQSIKWALKYCCAFRMHNFRI